MNILDSLENVRPADIERRSMEIIESEMGDAPQFTREQKLIVKRVIHTTADFEYLHTLRFSSGAVESGLNALKEGAVIVTDTRMALAGISKPAVNALGCQAFCYMADPAIAEAARRSGTTRAVASMDHAAEVLAGQKIIFAVGNAPTALVRLYELIREGRVSPALVIGVPVGFVNVVQSKELILRSGVPFIVAEGRKGGSNVAAAICNALLYQLYDRSC